MHPIVAYELARIRIDELHAEARRERLAHTARPAGRRAEATPGLPDGRTGLLQRLLARLTPAASGA